MECIYADEKTLDARFAEKEKKEFFVILSQPEGDKIRWTTCHVNINSPEIDKDEVCMFAGMDEEFDAGEFACACVEYYGARFWAGASRLITKEEAAEKIKKYTEDIKTEESKKQEIIEDEKEEQEN